ncbi:helix-turn-helix domain-containing protein [Spirosoma sp. SC4-14]|uniref:helix-turn-helix domain-containing protein n=1 Tax=Spirosoma sp. SC4-14 TaxID=3128900 RepID=UPI0030CF6F71
MSQYVDIKSISALHHLYGIARPAHPLITRIDLQQVHRHKLEPDTLYRLGFYTIFYKHLKGTLPYGKSRYDFEEGTLMFTAPNQVVAPTLDSPAVEGWGLCFHPDLLNRTHLGRTINSYSFFQYESNEGLHLSDEEKMILTDCINTIHREYSRPVDKHTEPLIINQLDSLLTYCDRFYDRQFITRAKVNKDIVQRFEALLTNYFSQDLTEAGLPDVKYFASRVNLSPNYLSDVLHRYTGKTTQEHIHLKLIETAKSLLWSTEKPISEIAYELGFAHPSHFTKLFKIKTGQTPLAYRQAS